MTQKGDLVLATKYDDGEAGDGWCIGYFEKQFKEYETEARYDVVNEQGVSFRNNGFRGIQKINEDCALYIISRQIEIAQRDNKKSLWSYLEDAQNQQRNKLTK